MKRYVTSVAVCSLLALLLLASQALAAVNLTEYEDLPFGVAVHPKLRAEFPALSSEAGIVLGAALPANLAALDLCRVSWPDGQQSFTLGIGQLNTNYGEDRLNADTRLAVRFGDATAQEIGLPTGVGQGKVLARLVIWPESFEDGAPLIALLSFSDFNEDSPIICIRINPDGSMAYLSTSDAHSLFGWFDCQDLDNDGTYELLCSRNLDGYWGGFFYHSVRSYDPYRGFVADPEQFKAYYREELSWLDWIINTRALIMANPQAFYNEKQNGPIYVAEYQGTHYAFDSIIELPAYQGLENLEEYNQARAEAFSRVDTYRDELSSWLAGGAYPSIWKMTE